MKARCEGWIWGPGQAGTGYSLILFGAAAFGFVLSGIFVIRKLVVPPGYKRRLHRLQRCGF